MTQEKRTKEALAYKGFQRFYYVESLNYFNTEIQLKDTESAIKSNLIDLLTHLKGFKLKTLVLMFKTIESKEKTKYYTFRSNF